MRSIRRILALILTLPLVFGALAQDDEASVPYFQSRAFNAPRLEGWENQSSAEIAQFHLPEFVATIRTAIVPDEDILAAVRKDLSAAFGIKAESPLYRGKVNLADGTWTVLIYEPDATISASVMARNLGSETVVISFVERDPTSRTVLLTLAQADDSLADASPEIATAVEDIAGINMSYLAPLDIITLPSGEWIIYAIDGQGATAMGMVFGNDSFVALRQGAPGDLPTLADAWNRTILGFFVTPDNNAYLALALVLSAMILGALLYSFYWRWRNLGKDLALIAELQGESKGPSPPAEGR